jgi:hypothetical protein
MKNQVNEQIQARKVKARLGMLQPAQRVSGNVSQTCRFFGVSRALFYISKKRLPNAGRFCAHDIQLVGRQGEVLYDGGGEILFMPGGNPETGVNLCKLTGER